MDKKKVYVKYTEKIRLFYMKGTVSMCYYSIIVNKAKGAWSNLSAYFIV